MFVCNLRFRCDVATDEHVKEAIRLFNVATMDAARSGINQQINLTAEMANEIKVLHNSGICFGLSFGFVYLGISSGFHLNSKQKCK